MYRLKVCVNDYIKSGIAVVDITVVCYNNSCNSRRRSSSIVVVVVVVKGGGKEYCTCVKKNA